MNRKSKRLITLSIASTLLATFLLGLAYASSYLGFNDSADRPPVFGEPWLNIAIVTALVLTVFFAVTAIRGLRK